MTLSEIRKLNPFKENTQKYRVFHGLVSKQYKPFYSQEFIFPMISQFHTRLREVAFQLPNLGLKLSEGKKTENGCKTYRIEEA